MSYFTTLRHTLGTYISPSTQAERRASDPYRTALELDRNSTSPTKRTVQWLETNTAEKSGKSPEILRVKGSKITKSFSKIHKSSALKLSEASSRRESASSSSHRSNENNGTRAKSRRSFWGLDYLSGVFNKDNRHEAEDELEGSTIIEDSPQRRSLSVENDTTLLNDIDDIKDQKFAAEKLDENEHKGWTKEEIWLFEKLQDRGFEPLLHVTWGFDFPTLPVELFTTDRSKVFIKSMHDNDYHAQKALEGLHFLGSRVRDRVARKISPESIIRRQFESYQKWSMHDAGLTNIEHTPVIAITSAAPKESVSSLVSRATDSLLHMGREYRRLWTDKSKSKNGQEHYTHEMPTLYGVAIKYTVVAFLTHDTTKPQQAVRSLAVFDMQQKGQDVWNGLAVAILFVRARNYLLELHGEGHLGSTLVPKADDSDA